MSAPRYTLAGQRGQGAQGEGGQRAPSLVSALASPLLRWHAMRHSHRHPPAGRAARHLALIWGAPSAARARRRHTRRGSATRTRRLSWRPRVAVYRRRVYRQNGEYKGGHALPSAGERQRKKVGVLGWTTKKGGAARGVPGAACAREEWGDGGGGNSSAGTGTDEAQTHAHSMGIH